MKMVISALALVMSSHVALAAGGHMLEASNVGVHVRELASTNADLGNGGNSTDAAEIDSEARLRARQALLLAAKAYHAALQADLISAQIMEDVITEIVGDGQLSPLKYAPGVAVILPLSVQTAIKGAQLVKYMVQAPYYLVKNTYILNRAKSTSTRVLEMSKVPFRYLKGVITKAAYPVALASAVGATGYHLYAIYLTPKEYNQISLNNEVELSGIDAELTAVSAEIAARQNVVTK